MHRYRRIVGLIETHTLEYYFLFFCPATLEFISFSVFPILSDQLLEEISYRCQELFLRQEHIEFKGSKLSLQWLAQLWESPVEDKGGVYKHWILE